MQHSGTLLGSAAPREAQAAALRVAQEAAARVPAYGRFLRLADYDANRLRTFADFLELPTMDKASYLTPYSVEQRCLNGDLPSAHMITLSSGTGGPASFWPRLPTQDPRLWAVLTEALDEYFHIRERSTLIVAAVALGAWGFGVSIVQAGQRMFSDLGLHGTIVTPGLNHDDTLRFVQQLGPNYDQTILVTYPAMAPTLLNLGQRHAVDWRSLNLGIFTSGEGVSEAQRERLVELLGRDPEHLDGLLSAFGASEVAGLIGYETRFCLLVRRLCRRTPELARSLFGTTVIPSLNQYNPLSHFLQIENDEVLLTMRGAVPLVRYNTHDRGGLLSFDEVVARCSAHRYDLLTELRARGYGPASLRTRPFMYAFGRSDAIIVHGGNVYLDQLADVAESPALRDFTTGMFEVSSVAAHDGRVTVRLILELRPDAQASDGVQRVCEQAVVDGLQRVSARFRAVYQSERDRVNVEVELASFGASAAWGPKGRRVALGDASRDTQIAP